jgi:hypothetical protein
MVVVCVVKAGRIRGINGGWATRPADFSMGSSKALFLGGELDKKG